MTKLSDEQKAEIRRAVQEELFLKVADVDDSQTVEFPQRWEQALVFVEQFNSRLHFGNVVPAFGDFVSLFEILLNH